MSSALASQLTQRFFRYLAITSQSAPRATTLPTTAGQHAMAQALADELRQLGLDEIVIDPFKRHTVQPSEQETHSAPVTLPLDLREFQQQQEKAFLQTSLQQAKFNQKKAAELLGLTYHQLRALLKKHQI